MRRGFNRYPQNGEEESHSENPEENPLFNPLGFGMLNQFPSFSSNGSASEGIIVSLFQIVEQQSRALQAMVGKVESITQKTLELTEKIKDLKYSLPHSGRTSINSGKPRVRRRGKATERVKL